MISVAIALGTTVWLLFLLLSVGLARAAARGDLVVSRALAVERAERSPYDRVARGPRGALLARPPHGVPLPFHLAPSGVQRTLVVRAPHDDRVHARNPSARNRLARV